MTLGSPPARSVSLPALLILSSLLALLGLVPPETRVGSLTGCSALVALLCLLQWRAVARSVAGPALIASAVVLALPLAWAALVPGATVEPLALALVAAGGGLAAASLGAGEPARRRVVAVLAGAGAGAALHGVYQKLWGIEQLTRRVAQQPGIPDHEALLDRLEGGRAFAGFMTPAALGGFLALCLPVTLGLALAAGRRGRWGFGLVAALQLSGLVAAASASATAALVGAGILAAIAWSPSRRRLAALLGGALVLLALVAVQRGGIALRPGDPAGPWRLRAGNFRAAIEMAADHPWKGVGPGGFAEAYPSYRHAGDNETRHAHNLPLELAAEFGWVGAALVSALFFWVFLMPLGAERGRAGWRRGLAVGLAAFALHNLADFTVFMPSLLWTAALCRGLLAPIERRPATASVGLPSLVAYAGLAGVLVAAVLTGRAGLSFSARLAARSAAYAGDTGEALRLATRAARWAPWDVDAALMLARATERAAEDDPGLRAPALERAGHAVDLSPVRPSARAQRARVRLLQGDLEGAYADLQEAAQLYPLHERYARERDLLAARLRGAAR